MTFLPIDRAPVPPAPHPLRRVTDWPAAERRRSPGGSPRRTSSHPARRASDRLREADRRCRRRAESRRPRGAARRRRSRPVRTRTAGGRRRSAGPSGPGPSAGRGGGDRPGAGQGEHSPGGWGDRSRAWGPSHAVRCPVGAARPLPGHPSPVAPGHDHPGRADLGRGHPDGARAYRGHPGHGRPCRRGGRPPGCPEPLRTPTARGPRRDLTSAATTRLPVLAGPRVRTPEPAVLPRIPRTPARAVCRARPRGGEAR